MAISSHTGPLPPPDMLRGYGEVLPGLPERIVGAWEAETANRRGLETTSVHGNLANVKRGQYYGMASVVLLTLVGLLFAYMGQPWLAGSVIGATLVSIVAIFVTGQHSEKPSDPTPEPEPKATSPSRDGKQAPKAKKRSRG